MNKMIMLSYLLVFIAISFLTLPCNPLQNDDASLYALAAKNAVIHNMWLAQFITPGDPGSFLDKPPLGIWLLAWPLKVFGVNELTVHLPNILYFSLLLGLFYFLLARLASHRLARYSTLVAASSLCLVVFSRTPKLDVPLTFFVMLAGLAFYGFIKNNDQRYLLLFTLSLAGGFLVKSGHGIIFPGLTALTYFIFDRQARARSIRFLFSFGLLLNLALFAGLIGSVLWAQRGALGEEWFNYLRSITIQSKYNTSYTALGFYSSAIGFFLLAAFPWMPFIFNRPRSPLTRFANFWLWSNLFYLLFFYRQNDLRTVTVLVPPLAILAGTRLCSLTLWSKKRAPEIGWGLFYFLLFLLILISIIFNPQNAHGNSLTHAIVPVAFFVLALGSILIFTIRPSRQKLAVAFTLTFLSYSVLFFNSRPLVNDFNPDLTWPKIISEKKAAGAKFYIYRPPDRNLIYSPDLFWVDFMSGPADQYFWERTKLEKNLKKGGAILLSDTASWKKLQVKSGELLAQDNYSVLVSY